MTKTCRNLLIRNASEVMTGLSGPDARAGAVDIRVGGGRIVEMGPALQALADEPVLDVNGCVIYPGWVNTHHHLFQTLLKGVPAGLDQSLSGWLAGVPYPRLGRYDPETVRAAARVGLTQLLLSGATTCADHHYSYHADASTETADVIFEVAEELGVRLVLCRGGALQTSSQPGFGANVLVPESLDAMVADIERLKSRYHDPAPDAMTRVVLAPTTPTFSVLPWQLRELARAARAMGLRLHTHLSETGDYVTYCRERHGLLPVQFMAEHEWLGPDIWFAHLVHMTPEEIDLVAGSGAGLAHCPSSNCRLGSGIAPVPEMAEAGIPVSLGVDGPASNESGGMLAELRMAWLLHRATHGATATTVEQVIGWASVGGARVLDLPAVGTLQLGMAADLVAYDLGQLRNMGFHDPALAPVIGGEPVRVRYSVVQGRVVVDNGVVPGLDEGALREDVHRAMSRLG
ncbi:MAG: amidohydrolase family protein [Gammaproteobacteria bacterium]